MSIQWPSHKCSLFVEHNRHLNYYETVEQALQNGTHNEKYWPDQVKLEKSKETGEVWEIQWYPDTPVSFYCVAAATFEKALEEANKTPIEFSVGQVWTASAEKLSYVIKK